MLESSFSLCVPLDFIVFGNVSIDSEARTNAVTKYVVKEAHTYDLTSRPREADESGC